MRCTYIRGTHGGRVVFGARYLYFDFCVILGLSFATRGGGHILVRPIGLIGSVGGGYVIFQLYGATCVASSSFVTSTRLFARVSTYLFIVFRSIYFGTIISVFCFSILGDLFSRRPFSNEL